MSTITVTPPAATLQSLGDTIRFSAIARDQDGRGVPGQVFQWTVSDTTVARVSAGLVTALANGSATVTARTDDLSGTAAVVVEQTVATVQLSPPDTVLTAIGDTVRLTASALDARGQPVAKETAWISSATSVATVSAFGLVTAVSNGAATITATVDGVTASVTAVVDQAPARLAFLVQPGTTQAGIPIVPAVEVAIQDSREHVVSDLAATIAIVLESHPSGAVLSGSLSVAATNGVGRFSDLAVDRTGSGFQLAAASGGLSDAISSPFDIMSDPARIDSVKLSSTTIPIGGLGVPYTAWVVNGSGRTMTQAGIQGWIRQGAAVRAAGGTAVNCGLSVGDLPPGACAVPFTLGASNGTAGSGTLVPGAATALFELSAESAPYDTVVIPIVLESFTPPPVPAIGIDTVRLASTTLQIGGPGVSYVATVTSASPDTVPDLVLQGWITQGSVRKAAGGTALFCGGQVGELPPGTCAVPFTLSASNLYGTGTLIPGTATAVFELRWTYGTITSFSLPITLVN